MMTSTGRQQLEQRGYWIARGVLDPAAMRLIARCCDNVLPNITDSHRSMCRAQGSIMDISEYPEFSDVIGHGALAALFAELGLAGLAFNSGSIISKPPGSPALFWHQDWWAWDDAMSYTERIPQVNVMIYLCATSVGNGCLRVIPGSHRRKHAIHEFPQFDALALSRVEDPDHQLYQSWPQECAVTIQPGDVVVKDARLLHSAYANASSQERTLLSLNFNPGYAELPAPMQARIRSVFRRQRGLVRITDADDLTMDRWPEPQRRHVEHFFPAGAQGEPMQIVNMRPDPALLQA
jgi:hypothetical protein